MDNFRLDGKVALVTGGGSGMGRATTKAFAQAGAKRVYVAGRRPDKLEETKVECQGYDCEVVCVPCDIGNAEERKVLVERVNRCF